VQRKNAAGEAGGVIGHSPFAKRVLHDTQNPGRPGGLYIVVVLDREMATYEQVKWLPIE
jgi:hypothetical protein